MPRYLPALLLCLAAAACSDAGTDPQVRVPIDGVYSLQTINGRPLPVTLIDFFNTYRLQQTGGTITLNTDRTFIERAMLRETIEDINGPIVKDTTVVLNGAWEVEQDSVILLTTQQDGSVLFGTVSNGRLTLHFEPNSADSLITYVYRKP